MALLMISYIECDIRISTIEQQKHMKASFTALYGLLRYQADIPGVIIGDVNALSDVYGRRLFSSIQHSKLLLDATDDLWQWLKRFFKHVECTSFTWKTEVGAIEASHTAMISGIVWTIQSCFTQWFVRCVKHVHRMQLKVTPNYHHPLFSIEIHIATRIRVIAMMWSLCYLCYLIMRSKHGVKTWVHVFTKPKVKASI